MPITRGRKLTSAGQPKPKVYSLPVKPSERLTKYLSNQAEDIYLVPVKRSRGLTYFRSKRVPVKSLAETLVQAGRRADGQTGRSSDVRDRIHTKDSSVMVCRPFWRVTTRYVCFVELSQIVRESQDGRFVYRYILFVGHPRPWPVCGGLYIFCSVQTDIF